MMCPYGRTREIGTTADVALKVDAGSLSSLFAAAAWGMTNLIISDSSFSSGSNPEIHDCTLILDDAEDLPMLMVDWLSELLFLFESRQLLFTEFDIIISDTCLRAQMRGIRFEQCMGIRHNIKGVTWHGLMIKPKDTGYQATILFDV